MLARNPIMETTLLLLLSFSLSIYGTSVPVPMPTGRVCPINEEICGRYNCYNPGTNVCLHYKDGSGGIVCEIGDTFCNGQCLSPSSGKICASSAQHSGYEGICDPGESICRWRQCYDPQTHDCVDGNFLCNKGQLVCGRDCYDPSTSIQCVVGRTGWHFLCSPGERVCSSLGCYNPQNKTCFEEEHVLCNVGEELCWKNWVGGCVSREAGEICLRNNVVCKVGQEACGKECYNPNGDFTCTEHDILCEKGQASCGNQCYNPSAGEQCFNQKGSDYYVVCPKGQSFCNYQCYDPKDGACLPASWGEMLCPINSKVCGYYCYNPTESECHTTEHMPIVCPKNKKVCGRTCYEDDGTKVCHGNVLCESGQELCGGEFCYDPLQSKCEDLPPW